MKSRKVVEKLAQVLAVLSFVLMCWVTNRSLEKRTQCVNSPFIAFVQIGSKRVENCIYESRLSLKQLVHPLDAERLNLVRKLETLDPLASLFPVRQPRLAVDISLDNPHAFTLGHGFVRLGRAWLEEDSLQTLRGLIMGVINRERPKSFTDNFQLEVVTDFLLLTVFHQREWYDHQLSTDIKFSTSAPSFAEYCRSPFRSLAHFESCQELDPDSADMYANVWGFRPLLAVALWRVYEHASLSQKLKTLHALRFGQSLPMIATLREEDSESMVHWVQAALEAYASSMRISSGEVLNDSVKRTMKELEVESPTHWELTVDITNTPAWKEILVQFQKWSHFHQNQRTLVFTPEGTVALPANLPVAWSGPDIHSQTHVMIACAWPQPEDTIAVTARHVFAKQTCGKVENIFWN